MSSGPPDDLLYLLLEVKHAKRRRHVRHVCWKSTPIPNLEILREVEVAHKAEWVPGCQSIQLPGTAGCLSAKRKCSRGKKAPSILSHLSPCHLRWMVGDYTMMVLSGGGFKTANFWAEDKAARVAKEVVFDEMRIRVPNMFCSFSEKFISLS